jgi:hypothetical protein
MPRQLRVGEGVHEHRHRLPDRHLDDVDLVDLDARREPDRS